MGFMQSRIEWLKTLAKNRRYQDIAGLLALVLVLLVMSWRLYSHAQTEGPAQLDHWALASYRDAIYYPIRAVLEGVNPYESRRESAEQYMQRYDVGSHFPLYSPLLLALMFPLGLLPYGASMLAFFVLNLGLLLLLAYLSLRSCQLPITLGTLCGLAAAITASQPGRGNFNAGQAILLLACAAAVALGMSQQRWARILSVALLTVKPTIGGPLGLLLLARREYLVAIAGLGVGGIVGGLLMGAIFARSGDLTYSRATAVIQGNLSHFQDDPEHRYAHTCHLDLASVIPKLIGRELPAGTGLFIAALVLLTTGAVLWYATRDRAASPALHESPASLSSALVVVAMFVCVYHLVYDALLLVTPILAASFSAHESWQRIGKRVRWSAVLLMLVPMVNIFFSEGFTRLMQRFSIPFGPDTGLLGDGLFRLALTGNGLALLACWILLLWGALRYRKVSPEARAEPVLRQRSLELIAGN